MEVPIPNFPSQLKRTAHYVQPFHKSFFATPTLISLVGPRGRGKTYSVTLYNELMFRLGFFTRFYWICPTRESNKMLEENVPVREEDIYAEVQGGQDAVQSVITKVEEDVQWYKDIEFEYKPLYQKLVTDGWMGLTRPEQEKMKEYQDKISDFYESFLTSVEKIMVSCPAIDIVLKGMKFPKSMELFMRENRENADAEMVEEEPETKDMWKYMFIPPTLPRPAPVLFIDDMSHTDLYSYSKNNPFINLMLRHRHLGGEGYGLTIETALQTFRSGLQKSLRSNTMQFAIFKSADTDLIKDIYQELGAFSSKEEFAEMYARAIRTPTNEAEEAEYSHDFLLVDLNPTSSARVFRRRWDTILLRDPDTAPQYVAKQPEDFQERLDRGKEEISN